jgi:hypothetical protein
MSSKLANCWLVAGSGASGMGSFVAGLVCTVKHLVCAHVHKLMTKNFISAATQSGSAQSIQGGSERCNCDTACEHRKAFNFGHLHSLDRACRQNITEFTCLCPQSTKKYVELLRYHLPSL